MPRRVGYLLMGVVWLVWGFAYPVTSIALRTLDVWSSRAMVMLLGGLVMLGLVALQGGRLAVPRDHWRDLAIAALLNMSIFQICMTYGVELLSAGRTAVIVYTMPLWTALFAVWLLDERLGAARVWALVLGLAGLAVLLSQDLSALKNAPLGAALTLVAAISFGLGTVWMKRRAWDIDATALGGWQLIVGVLPVLLVWGLIMPPTDWAGVSAESWFAIGFIVLVTNALGYFAWFRVVAIFPATVSGISAMAVPVVGVFASAVLVAEAVGWRELLALALLCLALGLNLVSDARRRAAG